MTLCAPRTEVREEKAPASAGTPKQMLYQVGWTTLPGLQGLSVSEFRAAPMANPDNERGVAVEFSSEAERDDFLRGMEEYFAARRFTNTADAFDTVKAYVVEHAAKMD